ncbi:MAG: hypothetical protein ACI9WL_000091 [Rubritalea sp.]|jgi:hypothetical protein
MPKLRLNADKHSVLFYNSKEFYNHRIIIKKGSKIEFDHKKPTESDLCALNLMKPGIYNLQSKAVKSRLKIDVKYTSLAASKESRFTESLSLPSQNIATLKDQSLMPNQGLVFNLGKGFTEFQLEMVQENSPKKGLNINDQTKKEAKSIVHQDKKEGTNKMKKKYQWKAK